MTEGFLGRLFEGPLLEKMSRGMKARPLRLFGNDQEAEFTASVGNPQFSSGDKVSAMTRIFGTGRIDPDILDNISKPTAKNFPSIDAFTIHRTPDGITEDYLLQLTVSLTHTIKLSGLKTAIENLPAGATKFDEEKCRVYLIFYTTEARAAPFYRYTFLYCPHDIVGSTWIVENTPLSEACIIIAFVADWRIPNDEKRTPSG